MIYRQTPLYKFIEYCNNSGLEKKVVDCGAGGNMPPRGLFYSEGYETMGIEIFEEQIALSKEFEEKHNMKLNITKGNMKELPFKEGEIPMLYSFGSIFHMKKSEIRETINEFKRVLSPNGLCYLNLLYVEDFRFGEGTSLGDGQFLQDEYEAEVTHSYFEKNEGDEYFEGFKILYKEVRVFERIYEGKVIKQGYIDYIVRKN